MKRVVLVLASVLFMAFGAMAQTNGLSEAEVQGQQLAWEILQQRPTQNSSMRGIMQIQNAQHQRMDIPVQFDTGVGLTNVVPLQLANNIPVNKPVSTSDWETDYKTLMSSTNGYEYGSLLAIFHSDDHPNVYAVSDNKTPFTKNSRMIPLSEDQIMAPFAGSDFWIADLGLEFFHWPEQKILKHETKRTRACAVLESTNPNPSPGGYSRVVTWIDNESLAIIWAEAYDTDGKLLKVFNPKKVKKVNGQWELEDMEIRNQQTGSRTWIKFDLNAK